MVLYSCFYSKPILWISQEKGLKDSMCGCSFESFGFIGAGASMAKLPKLPVPSFSARIIKKRRKGAERGLRKPRIVPPTKQRKV